MFIAASAALVLSAACTKTEVTRSLNDEGTPIAFSNYAARDITKAASSNYVKKGATLVNGQKFGVFAYNTGATATFDAASAKPAFMNNVAVTFTTGGDSDASKNTYSPARYWPKDEVNNHLFFYAYYPVVDGGNITVNVPPTSAGYGSYTYVVDNTDVTKGDDFMLTDLVSNKRVFSETTDGVVPLTFRHQLAKVRFAVKSDIDYTAAGKNTTITITKFLLKGINTKGVLAPTGDATSFAAWTPSSEATDKKDFDIAYVKNALTASYVPAEEAANNVFLMIPQALTGATLEIEYTVDNTVDEVVTNKKTITLTDILKDGDTETIGTWYNNNSYVYQFIFSLNEIKFTAKTVDWAEDTTATLTASTTPAI